MASEGGGVGGGGNGKMTGAIPGADVSKKVIIFNELAAKQSSTGAGSSSSLNRRIRVNGSGRGGGRACPKEEETALLGASEGDRPWDMHCVGEGTSTGEDATGNLQERKGEEEGGGAKMAKGPVDSVQVAEKERMQLGADAATSLKVDVLGSRNGNGSAAEKGMSSSGGDCHGKDASPPQQQKEAAAGELENGIKNSSGAAGAKPNDSTNSLVPQGGAQQGPFIQPNWEGMEDAAALQMFVRRAVKDSLEAAAVKEHLEGTAGKDFTMQNIKEGLKQDAENFVRQAVREGLEGAAVKDFMQQNVMEFLNGAAVKDLIQHEVNLAIRKGLDAAVKDFMHEVVMEVFNGASVKDLIQREVNQAVAKHMLEAVMVVLNGVVVRDLIQHEVNHAVAKQMPAAGNISDADHLKEEKLKHDKEEKMKREKDIISEHVATSRALFAVALAFTLPYMVARKNAKQGKDDPPVSDDDFKDMAVEMGLAFLFITLSYVYLFIYHFIRTSAPGLSLFGRITTASLLGSMVTVWMVFYTMCVPRWLYKGWYWAITGSFLFVIWCLTISIGFCKFSSHKRFMEKEKEN